MGRFRYFSAFAQRALLGIECPEKQDCVLNLACELFPTGPPENGVRWKRLRRGGAPKFSEPFQLYLDRSAPTSLT